MPQLPKNSWGNYKNTLKKLIDRVAADNKCDKTRISISGHSLGANGAMDMLFAFPNYFSAASILSPCKDYGDKLKELVHIPLWFLHGEKEHTYKKYARSMASRFEKLGGTSRLTSVAGYGHPIQFCWVSSKYKMFEYLASFVVKLPVYPTWDEYIKSISSSIDKRIPADIAKRLGLEPTYITPV